MCFSFSSSNFQLHSNMDKGDGSVRYILTGDGAGTLFLIDEKSGDIHATKRLDREEKAMYTLNAKVVDRNTNSELEPDTEFNIKIHDINDNAPKFAKDIYFASVPEMSDVGKLVLQATVWPSKHTNRMVWSHLEGKHLQNNSCRTLPYFVIVICSVRLIGHS